VAPHQRARAEFEMAVSVSGVCDLPFNS
jgi:hypothetical protein